MTMFGSSRVSHLFARTDAPPPSWAAFFAFGLLTRLLTLLLGWQLDRGALPVWLLAQDRELVAAQNQDLNSRHLHALATDRRRWIKPWYRWDAIWYAEISEKGYAYQPGKQSSVAFLPLLPMLMRGGALLGLDPYWVGLVFPNLMFPVGLMFFGKTVLLVTNDSAAAVRSVMLLAVFPWSFFFSAPYQESLAFALTSASIYAWLRQQPLVSALCISLATAARLGAAAFSVAVLLEWADDFIHGRKRRDSAWLVGLSGFLGFGLFSLYLYLRFDDPFLHLRAHEAWGRRLPSMTNLLWSLLHTVLRARESETSADYLVMISFIVLGTRIWRKRGAFWGSLVLVPVIQVMASGTIVSLTRVALAAFPAAIEVAEMLTDRVSFAVCVCCCVVVQAFVIGLYVNWYSAF